MAGVGEGGGAEFDPETGEPVEGEDFGGEGDMGGGGGGADFGGGGFGGGGGGGGFDEGGDSAEEGEMMEEEQGPTNIFDTFEQEKEDESPWVEEEDQVVNQWTKEKRRQLDEVKPLNKVNLNDNLLGEI